MKSSQHSYQAHYVDFLNIGLIFASLWLAVQLPFELFLFSYAVLGPLHYLTEINWLRERQFFTAGRRDWWWLAAFAFLIFLSFLSSEFLRASTAEPSPIIKGSPVLYEIARFLEQSGSAFVFIALGLSAVFVFIRRPLWRWVLGLLSVGIALLLRSQLWYSVMFGMLVPTIVHVWLFTALFMLFGAIKHRSLPGFLSVLSLLVAVLIILKLGPGVFSGRQVDPQVVSTYFLSKFQFLNLVLFKILAPSLQVQKYLREQMPWAFMNTLYGWRIQTLIAFAYTYHYLNWFSKTGIIRWHRTNRKNLALAAGVWVLSVALYFYNYHVGLVALFFLSMLHVFLEFPLNVLSVRGIIAGLGFGNLKPFARKTS
ncbi:MAG: hypothetical protein N2110_07785 [Flavobacteriales bacterium]|nr:hypothetical protein [Flavobacteriales bacterium]MCX7768906.1 hypothetical protein [Flavobacteriales bacterium]MDW8410032.1 hypothetical protein [Flavobacteriales bacterium]